MKKIFFKSIGKYCIDFLAFRVNSTSVLKISSPIEQRSRSNRRTAITKDLQMWNHAAEVLRTL